MYEGNEEVWKNFLIIPEKMLKINITAAAIKQIESIRSSDINHLLLWVITFIVHCCLDKSL